MKKRRKINKIKLKLLWPNRQVRDAKIGIRITQEQKACWVEQAQREGARSLTEWIETQCNNAVTPYE